MQHKTSQLKDLGSRSVLYSLPQILGLLGSIILIPIFTRYLSQEDFGLLAIFLTISGIGGSLSNLKMESAIYRYHSEYTGSSKKDFLATIFFTKVILSAIIAILFLSVISLGFVFGIYFEKFPFFPYIPAVTTLVFLISCSGFQLSLYVAEEEAKKHVCVQVLGFFVTNFLALFFIIHLGEDIWGRIKAMLITEALIFFLMISITVKRINFTYKKIYIEQALHFSLPLYMGDLVNLIYKYTDRIILAFYVDISKIGLLYISDRIAILIQSIFRGFEKSINPFIFNKEDKVDQKASLENIFNITVSISCLILLIYLNLAEIFLREFIDPKFNEMSVIAAIKLLGVAYFLTTIYPFFSIALGIHEKTRNIFLISFFSSILNIFLNLIFIPKYGWLAAPFSTLICCLFTCIGLGIFSAKTTNINFDFSYVILMTALTVSIYFILNNIISEYSILNIGLKTFIGTIILLFIVFKIFNLKSNIQNIK